MDPSKNPLPSDISLHLDDTENVDESYLGEMLDGVLLNEDENGQEVEEERFNINQLVHSPPEEGTLDTRRYDERDYQSHRRESFPQTHHPLRPLHSSSRPSSSSRRKHKTSQSSTGSTPTSISSPIHHYQLHQAVHQEEDIDEETSLQFPDQNSSTSPLIQFELDSFGIGFSAGASPVISQTHQFHDLTESPPKRVQFEIGGTAVHVHDEGHEKKRHRRHHHHHAKYEDPQWRLRQGGSELAEIRNTELVPQSLDLGPDVPTMDDLDQENLSTHRFGDNKGYRRHKFVPKFPEDIMSTVVKPMKYDHQPHEIFVELDVLSGHGEHREWKEAARWIKYEEDVEEGADRWGRPHVASLSFHSLINLRRLIETGVTLLDLEERDLPGVAYRAVEAMVVQELILPEDRAMIMRALLLKHRHVNESDGLWKFNLRRNTQSGSLTSLHAMLEDKNRNKGLGSPNTVPEGLGKMSRRNSAASRLIHDIGNDHHHHHHHQMGIMIEDPDSPLTPLNRNAGGQSAADDMSKLSLSNLSEDDVRWVLNKENLLRRIPVGAEASIVLVGKDEKLKRPIMSFIRLAEASYMPNITELPIPVRFIYILLGPSSFDLDYKEIGRSISTLMSNRHFHEIAYKANDRRDMLKGIHDFLDESIVLPPGDWDNELFPFEEMREKSQMLRKRKEKRRQSSVGGKGLGLLAEGDGKRYPDDGQDSDPLQRTKKYFGGMINEIKLRYVQYVSDIRDGFNFQTVASIIFIYFACVSAAIAFGGILGEKTEKHIGISETLIASAGAGVIFSIFSGQPLLIIGTTGPLLLFDESLFKICKSNGIDFLAFRFWIGIWVMVIGTVVVCFDGSSIARYFTRFVQEIFAAMIALLFIYDAINSLAKVYVTHPLQQVYGNCSLNGSSVEVNNKPYPNTALLSTVLCLGTFGIAYFLRMIRTSGYFTLVIRKFLGNFGVPIAIVVMVGLDYVLTDLTQTDKLNVPNGLENTKARDSWIVDISPIPIGMVFLAVVPAALVFILMFMESCICSLIIGKKENKLRKGSGFHLDIFLICVINGGIATIGGCWVCGATVRAVAHTSSLIVYSTNNPPGEKPTIVSVKEQRVSNFFISVLVGLSVLMSPALVLIPMSVLFGVFLYMGISSMDGIQFFDRVSLLFKQVINHPQVPYVRRVRTSKMHLFTVIQMLCLIALFAVKLSPAALAIPFLLILLVPLRMFGLKAIFKPSELASLDAKGLEPDEELKGSPEPSEFPILTLKDNSLKRDFDESLSATISPVILIPNGKTKDLKSI